MSREEGIFIWIMGLAGVGKSTLGEIFSRRLRSRYGAIVWLDGDDLRAAFDITGHSKATRIETGIKYMRLAKILVSQGNLVVLTSVGLQSPFEEYAKSNFSRYFQVLIEGEMDMLANRREFYRTNTKNVMGIDLKPDVLNFDLRLKNDPSKKIDDLLLQLEEGFENWIRNQK